jgi:hypothetical protein
VQQEIEISGKLSAEDYLTANLLHRSRPGLRLWFRRAVWILLAIEIPLFALATIGDPSWTFITLALVFAAAFILADRHVFLPRRARRIYDQQRSLQEPFTGHLTTTGMFCQSPSGTLRRDWADHLGWLEGRDMFLLYHSDVAFHILPKRFFDPADIDLLRRWLSSALRKLG